MSSARPAAGSLLNRVASSARFGLSLIIIFAICFFGFLFETFSAAAPLWQQLIYVLLGSIIGYGALTHLICHYGFVRRLEDAEHTQHNTPQSTERLQSVPFGALIPSFREEPEFIFRAVLSVALQWHDRKWIRLLVDDPPDPANEQQDRLLAGARAIPDRIERFMSPFRRDVEAVLDAVNARHLSVPEAVSEAHSRLGRRFSGLADDWPSSTPEDRFFSSHILRHLSRLHHQQSQRQVPGISRGQNELHALKERFCCDVASFERKQYANLSHTPNKAMNLNVAIDLLGRRFRAERAPDGLHLREAANGVAIMPDAEFLITLDADSLLSPVYAARLLGVITEPASEDIAVIQTPYSSLPEAETRLEKIAGATTDVQRILHQGFGRYEAAFWVGANAVLRVEALRDIAVETVENGYTVRRFIQDRTPIEDTESTIDLAVRGWRVHNYNAVLAWSATPPDFGALVIQRRRWACGGLIILPKALRCATGSSQAPLAQRLLKSLIRFHYLGSTAWGSLAVIGLLVLPLDHSLIGVSLPAMVVPYFIAYTLDLVLVKRSVKQAPAVYALNLLLTPVNIAGVLASVGQAVSGRKVPFARTPKINDRTAAPAGILLSVWGGTAFLLANAMYLAWLQYLPSGIMAGLNGLALLAGAMAYIGWSETLEDLSVGLASGSARRRGAPVALVREREK